MRNPRLRSLPAHLGHSLIGLLILFYTYLFLFEVPQVGFGWDGGSGRVLDVRSTSKLQVGDRLVQVGSVPFEGLRANRHQSLLQDARPGQPLTVVVERDGQLLTLDIQVADTLDWREVRSRLTGPWLLGMVFWLFGTLTLVLVRPRDNRWRLLITFNDLTAFILALLIVGKDHTAGSAIALRIAVWLCVPVYWHLHLIFPTPLGRVPRGLWLALYGAAGLLAVLEIFQVLPYWLYVVGLFIALLGIPLPNVVRLFIPGQSRAARYIWGLAVVAILPTTLLGAASLLLPVDSNYYSFAGIVLAWPALPAAYFLAAYRRQLAGLETRTSRAIGLYLYILIAGAVLSLVIGVINAQPPLGLSLGLANTAAGLLGGLLVAGLYAPFQRWVEPHLLGLPRQPTRFLAAYSDRLTASPDRDHLARLLRDDLLPGLLVRQSALLSLEPAGPPTVLYAQQVPQLPDAAELTALLAEADRYRLPPEMAQPAGLCAWVRVALPLRQGGRVLGLWLLGQRDPDDYYFQSEVDSLRILADQTAIALAHILQADRLRQLLQANVDRDEQERTQWALHLHDDILNELALLAPAAGHPAEAARAYERVLARVRQMISGLRPPLLAYGLRSALEQLADDLAERAGSGLRVETKFAGEARYPATVEQHLFRIVQQACENTLKHAQARTLRLTAALHERCVELAVEDDGQGLPDGVQDDLADLIAKRHFGLAGMFERAAFINADLRLSSPPGAGTQVTVTWEAPRPEQAR